MTAAGEFSHGGGILPPQGRGYVPTNLDRHRARMQTDSANPEANEEDALLPNSTESSLSTDGLGTYVPGTRRSGSTPLVTETGGLPATGQFKRLDPSLPKGGDPEHYADGLQDGSGDAWRASLPPNPVN